MLIFRKLVMSVWNLLVFLRVYKSYGMSNNKSLTMILFIEGAAFRMEIRVVFPISLLLWICGTLEQWNLGLSLMVHMVYDLVNGHESCLFNASVDFWNCGTVETGAWSLMTHMINDLQFSKWVLELSSQCYCGFVEQSQICTQNVWIKYFACWVSMSLHFNYNTVRIRIMHSMTTPFCVFKNNRDNKISIVISKYFFRGCRVGGMSIQE